MSGNAKLANFAEKMAKKYGAAKISNGPPVIIVPTGSVAIDYALRVGGLQLGTLVEVLGPKDSGKTTFGISVMVQHRLMFTDRGVAYVNLENTFDPRRATAMGLDCSEQAKKAGLWFPMLADSSEEASDMARDMCGSGLVSCVVIDSIGAMESDRVLGKEAEKAADNVGRNAKIITQMTKALSSSARNNKCTIVLVNQPRANIAGMAGAPDISAGPKAMQHSTMAKIEMRGLGGDDHVRKLQLPGEHEPLAVSIETRARVTRLKNGIPGRVAEVFVNRIATDLYGPPGFDDADSYLTLGNREGFVKVGGSYYTFPDDVKFNGRDKAMRYLRENPDAVKALRALVPFDTPTDWLDDDNQEGSEG